VPQLAHHFAAERLQVHAATSRIRRTCVKAQDRRPPIPSPCVTERVSHVPAGWIHARPGLAEQDLWKLTAGSTVSWCGNFQTDHHGYPTVWHWVSFKSKEEPWPHEGWMSHRILEIVQPQSTLSNAPAIVFVPTPATPVSTTHVSENNFNLPPDVAAKTKAYCASLSESYELQLICIRDEAKAYNELHKGGNDD
jgi:hypothetical protein